MLERYGQYCYTPLPWETKPDTIRLIELLPASSDEQIVCTISEASLSDESECQGLSYCWGNAGVQEPLIIRDPHGIKFSLDMRSNLFTALCQLRDPKYPKQLWADAICLYLDRH